MPRRDVGGSLGGRGNTEPAACKSKHKTHRASSEACLPETAVFRVSALPLPLVLSVVRPAALFPAATGCPTAAHSHRCPTAHATHTTAQTTAAHRCPHGACHPQQTQCTNTAYHLFHFDLPPPPLCRGAALQHGSPCTRSVCRASRYYAGS